MGDQKQVITTMVIKVDLGCEKCQKKIKKVLCKIPQIQNQIYDNKANTVTITVLSCCPEKIKQKICYKGGEAVKGIEIVKPKDPPKDKPKAEPLKPKEEPPKPKVVIDEPPKPPKSDPKPDPKPVPVQPPAPPIPVPVCCSECYQGIGGGPCYHGYGTPAPPPCFEAYGRPVYDSWGGGCGCGSKGYYVCRCEYVYDSPSLCTIM